MNRVAILALLALSLLTGCSGGLKEEPKPVETGPTSTMKPVEGKLKVALLTPNAVSDAGWSALAYEGLKEIEKGMGAEVNNQEAPVAQIRDAMRSYAQKGYNLIIGHGYEYNEPGVEVAKDFPNTVFVSSSGGKTAPNAGAIRFRLEEGFYLAGLAAGKMSKTGVVAMIGGPDVPSIKSTFKAFKAGAEAARPGIKVIETFTGKNEDVAAAHQATLAAIAEKADFVIHQANQGAQGVFNACKEKNVYAFGANFNQNDNPSGKVIASAVIVAIPVFRSIAEEVKAGTYVGSIKEYGMAEKAISFVWNPALQSVATPEVIAAVDAAAIAIISGELKVPMDKF